MSLPRTPIKGDAETRRFLEAIRQELLRTAGQMVTIADMRQNGFFTNNGIPLDFEDPTIDVPSQPTNLQADGAFRSIVITWDFVDYVGHSHSRIYRSNTAAFADAEVLANVDGRVYSDDVGSNRAYYYWVSNVNLNGIESATSQASGVIGQTQQDVQFLLTTLTNSIGNSQLNTQLGTRINTIETDQTNLQAQIDDLETTFGNSQSSADNLAAAQAAADSAIAAKVEAIGAKDTAVQAKVDAIAAKDDAVLAKDSAETSATNAATSSGSASSSASNAATSASQAASSASSAATSASAANTARTQAQSANAAAQTASAAATTAATNAQTFASDAETAATAANASEVAAESAKTDAQTSAASAATSASTATTAATNAASASTAAQTARTAAEAANAAAQTSATAAATSATNASSFADTASSAATTSTNASLVATAARDDAEAAEANAVSSASAAATSASAAGDSASSATSSANSASSSAASALASRNAAAQSATDAEGFAQASAQDYSVINARLNNFNGTGVSVEQNATATASTVSGLTGQYTVKIDNNGYVSGFGLASSSNNSAPTSEFIVRADSFSIGNPSGSGVAEATPFIVRTTPTTINGVSVPVGIYMSDAMIQNGSISNAKIGNAAIDNAKIASLDAAKITTGLLDAARITVDGSSIDSYFDSQLGRNRLFIRDLGVSNAKIKDLTIGTEKIQDLAITRSSSFFYNFNGFNTNLRNTWYDLTESVIGYQFVGYPNGDYEFAPEYWGYFFVGTGNGSYAYISAVYSLQAGVTTSATIAAGSQSVAIDSNLVIQRDGGSDDNVGARCVRTNDGTVMAQTYSSLRARSGKSTYGLFFRDDNPIAGVLNTYKIQLYNNNDNSHIYETSLRVTLFRK